MAKKKLRSTFWVVSTHVVTTGFAFPLAARIIGFAVLHETYVPRAQAFWFLLAVQGSDTLAALLFARVHSQGRPH